MGHCLQVVHLQDPSTGSCPVLRVQAITASDLTSTTAEDTEASQQQHLIPWVPAIVQSISHSKRTIVITPPPGLLELGRQQHLLHKLKPELLAYGKPAAGSMAERLGQQYMPTRRQLVAAGRQDLAQLVTAAGGFIHVAHLLGLRAKRKPEGV